MVVKGRSRRWWPYPAIAVIVVVAGLLLRAGRSSDSLATYWTFAVPLVALVLGWIAWLWRARQPDVPSPAVLGDRADMMSVAVRAQWEREAGERGLLAPEPLPVRWTRPRLPLAGPTAAAAAARRFDPLPGLPPITSVESGTGQISELHALYGGLGSGRLVIAGAPGAGKTGAAVLLVLAALRCREQAASEADRQKIPVPVLLTARDWHEPAGDWLAGQMRQAYPLFAGAAGAADAAALVATGKVSLVLDGLDEIAGELRPAVLQALGQAPFRVVVLSRTAEMASAASRHGILDGAAAIELCPVDPGTAADYLARAQLDPPPPAWRDLLDRVRSPDSALALALDNPLAITLVRDTYRAGEDVGELLEFCDAAERAGHGSRPAPDITGYLLDQVIRVAYTPRPGRKPPAYDLLTAHNALTRIAMAMNRDGTRDLQWWRIPAWAPRTPRRIVSALVFGLMFGLMFGLAGRFVPGLAGGLAGGIVFGLMVGFPVGFIGESGNGAPRSTGKLRVRRMLDLRFEFGFRLVGGLLGGLGGGLVLGLAVGLAAGLRHGLAAGLRAGPLVGLVVLGFALAGGLGGALAAGLPDSEDANSPSPVMSWRADRSYALVVGLVLGLVLGLMFGLAAGLTYGLAGGLVFGLAVGISSSRVWPSSLAMAQLAMRWHTPWRLRKFLDDARERNVLRTVGPVYQFRHARLQDRLAGASHHEGNDSDATSQSP